MTNFWKRKSFWMIRGTGMRWMAVLGWMNGYREGQGFYGGLGLSKVDSSIFWCLRKMLAYKFQKDKKDVPIYIYLGQVWVRGRMLRYRIDPITLFGRIKNTSMFRIRRSFKVLL